MAAPGMKRDLLAQDSGRARRCRQSSDCGLGRSLDLSAIHTDITGTTPDPRDDCEVVMATEDELKKALKAFKKKLKVTRLDDESGLGRGGGKKSGILGITPPPGYPSEIWEELVKAGKLKREMGNTYSVVEGA